MKTTTLKLPEESDCWRGVLARDLRCDGHFVFAVRTTGVYCRPSCPSRRPRRDRVVFFPGARQAEQAGFRPCRRCRPDLPGNDHRAPALLARACRVMSECAEEPLSLAQLSARVGVGPRHLLRLFRRWLGVTPKQFADARRLGGLKSRLRRGEDVAGALYAAGYGSSSRLYEMAPRKLGMTPAAYRRGGLGARIDYTVIGTPLGRLLVARTRRGICAVNIGASDETLVRTLRQEFPHAELRRDSNGLARWARALLRHLRGEQPRLDLPLDVYGTAFQCRVWEALCRIPYGETRTYSEVARAISRPRATRAVARACATNRIPLLIPCHRVVAVNGLGGYGLGLARKRFLLEMEKGHSRPGGR
jgi:AraC family transcriptional regulator of adaptative response/methylated-DNA-[protein]-cysteine methyltransferase